MAEDMGADFVARTRFAAELAECEGFTHTARALRDLLDPPAAARPTVPGIGAAARVPATRAVRERGRAAIAVPPRRRGRLPGAGARLAALARRISRRVRATAPKAGPVTSSGC